MNKASKAAQQHEGSNFKGFKGFQVIVKDTEGGYFTTSKFSRHLNSNPGVLQRVLEDTQD